MRRIKYFAVDIEKTAFAPYLIGIAKMLVSQTSVAEPRCQKGWAIYVGEPEQNVITAMARNRRGIWVKVSEIRGGCYAG